MDCLIVLDVRKVHSAMECSISCCIYFVKVFIYLLWSLPVINYQYLISSNRPMYGFIILSLEEWLRQTFSLHLLLKSKQTFSLEFVLHQKMNDFLGLTIDNLNDSLRFSQIHLLLKLLIVCSSVTEFINFRHLLIRFTFELSIKTYIFSDNWTSYFRLEDSRKSFWRRITFHDRRDANSLRNSICRKTPSK